MRTASDLKFSASRRFTEWLESHRLSLAFTTYQVGKLFFVGLSEQKSLSIFERSFSRCMGLCHDPLTGTLWMSSLFQLWRFENVAGAGRSFEGHDCVYVPQLAYTTGDLDIHDIAVDKDGPVFANTLFSCLARPSEKFSFEPVWQPPFISKLAAEDRCHLNGVTVGDRRVKYVSCISQSDLHEGWREHRQQGGVVLDVDSGKVVSEGLSMPHSPRLYRDRLWVLNSGRGEFGYVDLGSAQFVPIAFCPGYLRGLSFHGKYAVVGLSRPRNGQEFEGLELQASLLRRNASARCGLLVINIETGDIEHELRVDGFINELYDVCVLPKTRRPMAIGLLKEDIKHVISMPN